MEKPLDDFDPVGCTCPLTEVKYGENHSRYVVLEHTCPHCAEWNQRMLESGITEKRHETPKTEKKRRKKAA